ncbi:MAG: acyl--CoA ligase [Candidatus Marinimicrobia bacterium]|nr:acyl--CoA ligase [Candidatus Neomarinimicrobiota bacterium]
MTTIDNIFTLSGYYINYFLGVDDIVSNYSTFFKQVQRTPEDIFIYSGEKSLTYKEVFESSLKLANHFHQHGISKDTRVVVMLPNIPEMIYTWLALSRLEAMMIPVNINYKSLALRYIIDDSSAVSVIYHADNEEDVLNATNILTGLNVFIGIGDCKNEATIDFIKYTEKPLFGGPYNPDANDTNVMFYSGAATGPAKYAKYSNSQLFRNTNDYLSAVMLKHNDVIFSQFSLAHFIGYISVMNAVVNAGASIAICNTDNEDEVKKTLEISQANYMVAEPAYIAYLNKKNDKAFLPESIRYAITGGGRLKKDIHETFTSIYKIPVFKIYGMVEAGPILTVNTNTDKPTSIGTTLSNVTIALKKGDVMLTEEVIGEICVVSNILTEDLHKLLSDKFHNGWYHTGDLGRLDMDGYLYFVDRKAYVINVRGFDVYPEQVEIALMKHPKIRDVVVKGTPKDSYSESIHAYIIQEEGKRPTDDELIAFLEKELLRYQIPEKFIYVNHFPKSPTGKVVRQALK